MKEVDSVKHSGSQFLRRILGTVITAEIVVNPYSFAESEFFFASLLWPRISYITKFRKVPDDAAKRPAAAIPAPWPMRQLRLPACPGRRVGADWNRSAEPH